MSVESTIQDVLRRPTPLELQPGVQVTKAGGMYRARYIGQRDSVLGIDVSQALQRLSRLHRTGCRTPEYRKRERA